MNVVHIIMDTLKRSYLEPYGSSWVKTPNFQRFAAESVVFERAYCSSFPCMPARRDFLTGNFEFPFRGWGPLEESDITTACLAQQAGAVSGLITDHYHLFREGSGNYHFDFDAWDFIRGIEGDRVYSDPADELDIDYKCRPERIVEKYRNYYCKYRALKMKNEEDWFAPRTFKSAADWIKRNRRHKKFYCLIDSFPPHEPFDPPPGYAETYDPGYQGDQLITPEYAPWTKYYTERELKHIQALYAGMITHVDKWFGYFMSEMEKLGILENTMIIVSTDHGTYTGDHGWTGKLGTYLYDCVTHIPALILYPGVKPRRENALIQNTDIAPTVCDALAAPASPMHGKSLLPLLRGETRCLHEYCHSGFFGRQHIINSGRYALHLGHDQAEPLYWYGLAPSLFVGAGPLGPVENGRRQVDTSGFFETNHSYPANPALFDLETDPDQKNNIFGSEKSVVKNMYAELENFCRRINAPEEYLKRLNR